MLPGIIIGLTFHEAAHAYVSHWLGDLTPKMYGRLSLNPLRHIDPVGFLALIFAGFGWGQPVAIDPRYYKHRRRDELFYGAGRCCSESCGRFHSLADTQADNPPDIRHHVRGDGNALSCGILHNDHKHNAHGVQSAAGAAS